uniref:Uncharacterized protein n=1 Tax=Arundo donax TaxID=35708 RepID=A0A0A8ZYD5_ARUDO
MCEVEKLSRQVCFAPFLYYSMSTTIFSYHHSVCPNMP